MPPCVLATVTTGPLGVVDSRACRLVAWFAGEVGVDTERETDATPARRRGPLATGVGVVLVVGRLFVVASVVG